MFCTIYKSLIQNMRLVLFIHETQKCDYKVRITMAGKVMYTVYRIGPSLQ